MSSDMSDDWDVEVSRGEDCTVEFTVEVPSGEVDRERKQVINELKQSVDVPGFRKGKVPDSLIEKQYGDRVRQGLVQRLIPRICRTVYEEHDIQPVENPRIEDVQLNGTLRLEVSVHERPRLDVSRDDYTGIPLEPLEDETGEEAVEEQLEQLRSSQASLEPVPIARPVEDGDFVKIDFQGHEKSGEPVDAAAGQDQVIEVGSGRFLDEIEDGLVGASEGETRRIEASFPDDFVDDSLAGSTLDFEVTVQEIQEERKPDVDDEEFLDEMGVDSPEELRDTIRDQLQEAQQQASDRQRTGAVYDHLLETYDFTLPDSLLEQETDSIVEDYEQQVESRGRDFETFLDEQDLTREEMREDAREEAERRLRLTFILQSIAENEEIELSDEEFRDRLEEKMQGALDPEDLERLPDEQKQSLRHQMRDDKVLEFLVEHADIRDESDEEDDDNDSG